MKLPEENEATAKANNDKVGADDDTLGENTELTEIAKEILKDEDDTVAAESNQQNKDFSGED